MIVVLHGAPGDDGNQRLYETGSPDFKETVTLRICSWPGLDVSRIYGSKLQPATEHMLTFRFKFHDGTHYHYDFTGEVDGV